MQKLSELANELKTVSDQVAHGDQQSQKITIVNKVPRSILAVLREQFNLMKGWMAPLVEATTNQRKDMMFLKERLDETMQRYEVVIDKLESDPNATE